MKVFAGIGNVVLVVVFKEGFIGESVKKCFDIIFRLDVDCIFDNINIYSYVMWVFDCMFLIVGMLGNIILFIVVCGIFFLIFVGEILCLCYIFLLCCFGVLGKELVLIGGM